MKKVFGVILKVVLVVVLVGVIGFASLVGFLTITNYDPDKIETTQVMANATSTLVGDETLSFLTWNIGYCSLGADEDFFMDAGTKTRPDSEEIVKSYMENIAKELISYESDFIFLQEIDVDSKRSYHVDQKTYFDQLLSDYSRSFSYNYDVKYVPVPFPPLGKVEAGIGTYGKYNISEASRYALPGQYDWPKSVAMLDRCMLVSRLPIENKNEMLVIVNAHFSAYDDGSIRSQQLAFIKDFVEAEYKLGNYVVLGGDWNQTFPGVDVESFPVYGDGTFWMPYQIEANWIGDDWTFGISSQVPTYRLLDAAYEEGVTQTGVIDGFLVSPNLKVVETEVINLSFEYSDHNPVKMTIEFMN